MHWKEGGGEECLGTPLSHLEGRGLQAAWCGAAAAGLNSPRVTSGVLRAAHFFSRKGRCCAVCYLRHQFSTALFSISQVFKEEKYLKDAVECSDVIWQRGLLRKGYGICHGTAGNGYAFLSLYHITQDKKYLYRACKVRACPLR